MNETLLAEVNREFADYGYEFGSVREWLDFCAQVIGRWDGDLVRLRETLRRAAVI